jgi:uncharacterized membrane protein YfcA
VSLLYGILFVVAGVGAGIISTAFGIGGGALSTPAIRALGTSALMSIGTTLPPVLPGVITGVLQYRGKGLIRYDVALAVSIPGAIAAVAGSLISHHLPGNGHVIMLITAGVLLLNALRLAQTPKADTSKVGGTANDSTTLSGRGEGIEAANPVDHSASSLTNAMADESIDDSGFASTNSSGTVRVSSALATGATAGISEVLVSGDPSSGKRSHGIPGSGAVKQPTSTSEFVSIKGHYFRLVWIGIIAGLISGGLGLGGGIVLVPVFARKIGLALRESTATSLVCIGILAIPSIITHSLIGDIDWTVAALLTIGTIPGAHFGAKLAMRASDVWLRRSASAVLSIIAVIYAVTEVMSITLH